MAALLLAGCSSEVVKPSGGRAGSVGAGGRADGVGGSASSSSGESGAAGHAGDGGGGCDGSPEVCDGVDNNCDGVVDEWAPALDNLCETGLLGACAAGQFVCSDGALVCTTSAAPMAETCNGIDDDCDGEIDEEDPGVGMGCDTGDAGVCGKGESACIGGALVCVPATSPSFDVCDLLDNDCDGTADNGVSCARRVFVTSSLYSGDLGGLEGADAKCQAAADAASVAGVYRAWLSTDLEWASQHLNHVGAPYLLVDGATTVAADWDELTSGTLQHAIDLTELGGPPPVGQAPTEGAAENTCLPGAALVWSETGPDGTNQPQGYQCFDWTTTQTGLGASFGVATAVDASWTMACTAIVGACGSTAPLYCVEQ